MDGIAPVSSGGGYLASKPTAYIKPQAPAPADTSAAASKTPALTTGESTTSAETPGSSRAIQLPQSPVSFAANRTTAESFSSVSMAYESQSLNIQSGAAASNNELLGAVLLLLLLEYMSTQDQDKKDALLGAIVGLASLQAQQQDTVSMNYSSTSLSMQSTQLQMISSDSIASTYNGAMADTSRVPLSDPSSGGGVDAYA